ncbi:MAG: glycosyltransferase [Lachnospiraceae bacterium]|nr:glycosyltransferase [Lachnospiraceae bacterium]
MNVLVIIPSLEIGGAETMVGNLAVRLKEHGVTVTVLTYEQSHSPIAEQLSGRGIRLMSLGKSTGIDVRVINKIKNVIRQVEPQVIHTHTHALLYTVLASGRIPIVHTLHSIADKEQSSAIGKTLARFIYRKAGKVVPVAISETVKDSLVDGFKVQKPVPVIYNGVPVGQILKKHTYSCGETIEIFHVGRIMHLKNHRMMIDTVEKLLSENHNVRLHFYGEGADKEELMREVRDRSLDKNIIFEGLNTGLFSELCKGDIFVLPSQYEGMPMSLIEAMAAGLPCIATNVGGARDVMEEGVSGLLCDPEEESFANRLRVLIQDETLRKKLGENAIIRASRFSDDSMAQSYINLYNSVLEKK